MCTISDIHIRPVIKDGDRLKMQDMFARAVCVYVNYMVQRKIH